MVTFDTSIKKAWDIYINRDKYCYLYGAKGVTVTRSSFNQLLAQYPDRYKNYTDAQIENIFKYSEGKTAYDCSGFITALTGDYNYSAKQWANCKENKSLAEGVAASILYKPGHIGFDMGYGIYMHFPSELHTAEIGKIAGSFWQKSGLHKNIDYTGSINK